MTDGGQGSEEGPTPAGWYADAQGDHRWWDGEAWTEHTITSPPASPLPTLPPSALATADPGRRRGPVLVAVLGVLVVAAVVVGLIVALVGHHDGLDSEVAPPTTSSSPTQSATESSSPTSSDSPSETSTPTTQPPTSRPPTTLPPLPRTPSEVTEDFFTQVLARSCTLLRDTTDAFDQAHGYTARACRTDPTFFGTVDRSGCSVHVSAAVTTGRSSTVRFVIAGGQACPSRGRAGLVQRGDDWLIDTLSVES